MKILIIILCAVLWRLGGWDKARWSGWRDVLIPLILGVYLGIQTVWWVGLVSVLTFNIIRMGRGIPDSTDDGSYLARFVYNILNINKSWVVRGLYGFICALIGGACAFVYLPQYVFYTLYCILNFSIDAVVEKMRFPAVLVELAEGAAIGSIVLFI